MAVTDKQKKKKEEKTAGRNDSCEEKVAATLKLHFNYLNNWTTASSKKHLDESKTVFLCAALARLQFRAGPASVP